MAQTSQDVLTRFASEIWPQLNRIGECWTVFRGDTTQVDSLQECAQLSHSVKTDASSIGLSGFSHIAFLLSETLLDLASDVDLSDAIRTTVDQLVSALNRYIEEIFNEESDERTYLVPGLRAYRRLNNLPESADDAEIQRLVFSESRHGASTSEHETQRTGSAIVDTFRETASDHLQVATDLLTSVEVETTDLIEICQSIQSVVEGASTVGLKSIAELADATKDVLTHLVEADIRVAGDVHFTVGRAIDALSDLTENGHTEIDIHELYVRFSSLTGKRMAVDNTAHDATGKSLMASSPLVTDHALDQQAADEIQADLNREISAELLAIYSEEAEDHIKRLYAGLNALQSSPKDRDIVQDIRRSAHTLKGAAGAVGLQVITRLSHRMEDLLDELYDGSTKVTHENLTILLNTADCLSDLSLDEFDQEQITATVVELYKKYDALLRENAKEDNTISIPVPQTLPSADARCFESNGKVAKTNEASRKTNSGQFLRVPIERVDDLVKTVGELIINRTTFEQRMADLIRYVEELSPVLARLRNVSNEVETKYSINALRSGRICASVGRQGQTGGARFDEFDDLEFDRYSDFHLTARSIAEATSDINTIGHELRTVIGDFDSLLARQKRLSRETQDRLLQIRMVPLSTIATRLHRAVRVVAANQNKNVDLIIEGENTDLDKTVLEELADPLLHLLRNAVDHGIESAEQRTTKGKPETAIIRIRAFYQGTHVVLRISDDGGGLDHTRIAASAIRNGHLSASESDTMTPQEIFPYIFLPGLSTAEQVSEVSGRGVGMDIVRTQVQKLKGTIGVDSEQDKGTTFTIRLPMTLSVTRALMVTTGGQDFAIPMQSVCQIARVDRDQIERLGNEPVIRFGDTACPLLRLSDRLGIESVDDESQMIPVLIVRSGDAQVAIRVERILSGRDIVVKTLGTHLRKVSGLIGATLLGDGSVVPILDPNCLTGAFETNKDSVAVPTRRKSAGNRTTRVMIVDDSVSVRRVMENLAKSQGWTPIVAKDGVDALEMLGAGNAQPDIFLLDIEMPRMDGYELLKTLRGMDKFVDTPIVMVTSRAGEKHRQKAFALRATDYMVKPYQDDDLVRLVTRLVEKESVGA